MARLMIRDGVCSVCGVQVKPALRHCYGCHQDLPGSGFGVNHYFKDGIHRYCKACIATAVNRQRANRKLRHESRLNILRQRVEELDQRVAEQIRKRQAMSGAELVLEAVAGGAHTVKQIALRAELPEEDVEILLCHLQIDTRQVSGVPVGNQRLYFIRETKAEISSVPRRRGCSLARLVVNTIGPVSHGESARPAAATSKTEALGVVEGPIRRFRIA